MEYKLILFIDILRIKAVESDLYMLASGKKVFKSIRQPQSNSFEWFELVWDFPLGKHPSSDDDYIYGISDENGFLYKVKQRSKLAKRNKEINISNRKFNEVQFSNNRLYGLEGEKLFRSPVDPIEWKEHWQDFDCSYRVRIDSEIRVHCIYQGIVIATHQKVIPTEKKMSHFAINDMDRVLGVSHEERNKVYIASEIKWMLYYESQDTIKDIAFLDGKLLSLKEISTGNGRVLEVLDRNRG